MDTQSEIRDPVGSRDRLQAIAVAALTAVVYFAAARYTIAVHDPVSLGAGFWPGAGITVTALLLCRTSWWPVILPAVGLAELSNDLSSGYGVTASLGWSVANMVEPLLAAALVRRFRASALSSVRDVGFFVAAACVAAPIVGGALGAVGTLAHGSSHGYFYIAVRWAIGDGLGILTIAPAGLLLLGNPVARRTLVNVEAVAAMFAVTVSALVVFFFAPWSEAGAYLVVPALLWAAIRFRVIGAAVSIFLVAQIADIATGQGYGAFTLAQFGDVDVILALQVYLATMAVTMLVVGARTHESIGHQQLAAFEEHRADLEDALARLARVGLESTDHEMLEQLAIPVLAPVVGGDRAHELVDDVSAAASGDRFSDSARSVLRSARRRLDAEAELVNALRQLSESTEALIEREAKLTEQAALLDETRDAIVVRDLDNRVTYWSRGAEQLYGWSAHDAMLWPTCDRLFADAAELAAATTSVLDRGEWSGELTHLTDAGAELTMDCRWSLMRDESGRPSAVMTICSDVTERRRLEQRILRTQRMESIGTLAGGLAHDLNNVLAPIMMSTDLLRSEDLDPDQQDLIRTIETSTERAGAMVRQILSFARGVEGRRINVDVDELLGDVERLANDMFLKAVRVVRDDSGTSWPVVGDPTQLHQVLVNLCVNARDAMPDGGILRLAADNVVVDDDDASTHPGASPGPHVRITVEDDGTGMTPATVDRIFEPFFTTKEQGRGTGLGLPTSAGIVSSHGGFIHVDSELGRGTRFHVHLPAAADDTTNVLTPSDAQHVARGAGELVLVIDDEDEVRTITRRALERAGYRVIAVSSGDEAITAFTEQPDIALVITDMMMPGLDGPTTIRALRRLRSDVAIVATSGVHDRGDPAGLAELGVEHFLAKPFNVATLLHAVSSAHDRDAGTAYSLVTRTSEM